jgi:hypothetical protein
MSQTHDFLPCLTLRVQIFQYFGTERQGELSRKTSGDLQILTQIQTTYSLTWGMLEGVLGRGPTIRGQVWDDDGRKDLT